MKLVWTRLALADLQNAYDYIAQEKPSAAAQVIGRIEKALEALLRHPHLGRPGRVEGTRELMISETPLVVPYRISGKRIEILGVIHGARQWPDSFSS